MKKTILLLILIFLSNIGFAQNQILDFFNKDLRFLEKNAKFSKEDDNGYLIFSKKFDLSEAYFMYSKSRGRVTSIIIPYSNKSERYLLEKSIPSDTFKSKDFYLIRTQMDDYLVQVEFSDENKIMIFY